MLRRAITLQIGRCRHRRRPQRRERARHQRRIRRLAEPQRQIQPLCHQIVHLLADHKLHDSPGCWPAGGEIGHQQDRRAHRDADAHHPGRRAAVLAERVLQVLRFLQQVPGPCHQILAFVGQAELAGRAVEQPDAEMLLQLRDLAGDRRLAAVAFPATAEKEPVSTTRIKML